MNFCYIPTVTSHLYVQIEWLNFEKYKFSRLIQHMDGIYSE